MVYRQKSKQACSRVREEYIHESLALLPALAATSPTLFPARYLSRLCAKFSYSPCGERETEEYTVSGTWCCVYRARHAFCHARLVILVFADSLLYSRRRVDGWKRKDEETWGSITMGMDLSVRGRRNVVNILRLYDFRKSSFIIFRFSDVVVHTILLAL